MLMEVYITRSKLLLHNALGLHDFCHGPLFWKQGSAASAHHLAPAIGVDQYWVQFALDLTAAFISPWWLRLKVLSPCAPQRHGSCKQCKLLLRP
jgi:hypothetical protein